MKKSVLAAVVYCLFSAYFYLNANVTPLNTGVNFYQGDLDEIMAFAGQEGKLSFVEFYADWCAPCKMMEETTFIDNEVSSVLNNHFIPIKVDVDDFDGYAWKEEHGVTSLPTMLIFNSKGKLIERIDESLSPSKLLKVLKKHNIAPNRTKVKHPVNISPKDLKSRSPYKNMGKSRNSKYSVDYKRQSYKLEVGVFTDHESTVNRYNELRKVFLEPIIVLNNYDNGSTRFHLLMGDFQTRHEAESFKKILKHEYDIESLVK